MKSWRIVHITSCLAFTAVCGLSAQGEDPRVTRLVEAHTSAVALIHELDAEMESTFQMLAGPVEGRTKKKGNAGRWSFDNSRQRFRFKSPNSSPRADGSLTGVSDVLIDGQSTRTIHDWTPDSTKQPSLLDQARIVAEIQEMPTLGPNVHLYTSLLLRFGPPAKPAVALRELLNSVPAENIEYLGKAIAGSDDEGLRVRFLPIPDRFTSAYKDIYFRPSLNYFATKVIEHQEGIMMANDKTGAVEPHVMEYDLTVKEFRDCGGGVWIPTAVETLTTKTGYDTPIMRVDIQVTKLTVNKSLPADALDFRFPENLFVRRISAAGKLVRSELWGADGKVKQEFNSTDDINKLLAAEAARLGKPRPSTRGWYLTLWLVGLGVLIAVVGYRQWQRRSR